MLQGEHSAILLTFIKLPFNIKIYVLSIFEWPLKTGFTVQPYGDSPPKTAFLITTCGKCSKTFAHVSLSVLSFVVFRAGIHKMLVRISNREDPDQTASSEAV